LATSGVVITDKDKINSLKGSLVEQGIPKELVNQWAKKGKEANKEKKASLVEEMGVELNGKEKERKREREPDGRRDPGEDNSEDVTES
ncbi:MAG: hypothetical protein GY941_22740, partial [Planctomycetes bacterium]|nr:hypothetical protein [Planctomycetota bacterium]